MCYSDLYFKRVAISCPIIELIYFQTLCYGLSVNLLLSCE